MKRRVGIEERKGTSYRASHLVSESQTSPFKLYAAAIGGRTYPTSSSVTRTIYNCWEPFSFRRVCDGLPWEFVSLLYSGLFQEILTECRSFGPSYAKIEARPYGSSYGPHLLGAKILNYRGNLQTRVWLSEIIYLLTVCRTVGYR